VKGNETLFFKNTARKACGGVRFPSPAPNHPMIKYKTKNPPSNDKRAFTNSVNWKLVPSITVKINNLSNTGQLAHSGFFTFSGGRKGQNLSTRTASLFCGHIFFGFGKRTLEFDEP